MKLLWGTLALAFPFLSNLQAADVVIQGISHAGSGCRKGSVAHMLAPDGKAFTLLFSSYLAEVGPGPSEGKPHKACRIIVDIRYPAGLQYTVIEADFRGFVRLESGARARHKSNLYFKGQGPSLKTDFTGPLEEDYHVQNSVGNGPKSWSPCKKPEPLTIESELKIEAKQNSRGLLTVDSLDGAVTETYRLEWRKCQPK